MKYIKNIWEWGIPVHGRWKWDPDTLEDSLVILYKTKYNLIIPSSKHTLWYLPKEVENLCPHKSLLAVLIVASVTLSKLTSKQDVLQ